METPEQVLSRIATRAQRLADAEEQVAEHRRDLEAAIVEAYQTTRIPLERLGGAANISRTTVYAVLKRNGIKGQ